MQLTHKLTIIFLIVLVAVIPVVNAQFLELNGMANATYTFTGTFVDGITGTVIPKVTVNDNLGFTTSAASGTFSNSYQYGTVTFTSTASGYAQTTTTVTMDQDITQNISMTASTGTDQVSYFTPHKVRFMCKDYMGAPIVDMGVSVYGVQTTLGSVDWVANLFGIDLDTTPILTTLMSGTTGNDGSIVFIMVETEKYRVQYIKQSLGINETRYYYPKQEEYSEVFWTETQPISSDSVKYGFSSSADNATYVNLGISYNDSASSTTGLTFYIDNETGENLYTETITGQPANITVSHSIPIVQGTSVLWGFSATSTNYAKPINATQLYRFEDRQWVVNPLNAQNGDMFAQNVYHWGAIGFIVIFALIFGRASIKFGVVIVPFIAMLFTYIGWFNLGSMEFTWTIDAIALTLGLLYYIRYAEEESGL